MPLAVRPDRVSGAAGISPTTLARLLVAFIILGALGNGAWEYRQELRHQQRLLEQTARHRWQLLETLDPTGKHADVGSVRRRFEFADAGSATLMTQLVSGDGRVLGQWPATFPPADGPTLTAEFPPLAGAPRVRVEQPLWQAIAAWRASLAFHLALVVAAIGSVLYLAHLAQRRQHAIEARERFIGAVTEHMPGMVGYWDTALICRFANHAYTDWFDKPAHAIVGAAMADVFGPELWPANEVHARAALAGARQEFLRMHHKADGHIAHAWVQYIPDVVDGAVRGFYALAADVTPLKIAEQRLLDQNAELSAEIDERKRLEQNLRHHQHFVAGILDGIDEHVAVIDGDGVIRLVNAAWERFARENGATRMDAVGVNANYLAVCALAYGQADAPQAGDVLLGLRDLLSGARDEYRCEYPAHSARTQRWFRLHGHRLPGDTVGAVLVHRDITDSKRVEMALVEQLAAMGDERSTLVDQALRDPLTSLNNRRYLDETLPRELARAQRTHTPVSAAMIDIDHFKHINDSHGHAAGDVVLQALAHLLREGTREGDLLCRIGGEEFLLVSVGMAVADAAARVDALRARLASSTVGWHGASIAVTFSAGVAGFPADALTMDELLACADTRLYRSKRDGRNRVTGADADAGPPVASGGGD